MNTLELINMLTGSSAPRAEVQDPFLSCSPATLSELIINLLPDGNHELDLLAYSSRSLIRSLMNVSCNLRDSGHINLHAGVISGLFEFDSVIKLSNDQRIGSLDRMGLSKYVMSLPDYPHDISDYKPSDLDRVRHENIIRKILLCTTMLAETYAGINKSEK